MNLDHLSDGRKRRWEEMIRVPVVAEKNIKSATGNNSIRVPHDCSMDSLQAMHRVDSGRIRNRLGLIGFEQASQVP